jgi:lincosamide nucleotidyltransferase
MGKKENLLQRLDEIGQSLAQTEGALAMLGLGSVGRELARLDDHSDLDFFVIVEPGYKGRFISELDWLSRIQPVAYAFQNTVDGHKLLFADGIFCEFAVFEPDELASIPFTPGRIVWQAAGFDAAVLEKPPARSAERSIEFLVGEAVTNLYIGLGRYRRGEKLSAARFIQGYAVDRIVELAARIEPAQPGFVDPFDGVRRFEQRFEGTAVHLPQFLPGYNHSPAAAQAILEFLDQHFAVNPAMKQAILTLIEEDS